MSADAPVAAPPAATPRRKLSPEQIAKMQAGRKKAAPAAEASAAAPETPTPEWLCWYETNLDIAAEVKRGRPERIWSADDPKWAEIQAKKPLAVGTLIVGVVLRVGDEFVPNSLVTRMVLRAGWEQARAKMRKWAADGRLWDTPKADALREHEDAVKQGQIDQANTIALALSKLVEKVRA